MKNLVLISLFCSLLYASKAENSELIFQGIKFYKKEVENLKIEPKYAGMVVKISFNNSNSSQIAIIKYDNEGNISFVGTDDNPTAAVDRGQCAGCGKFCASCESSLGAALCYLGCCFGIKGTDNIDFPSLNYDSKSFQQNGVEYAFAYRNGAELAQSIYSIDLYDQNESLNSQSTIGIGNEGSLSMIAFGKGVDENRAQSAFGKCLEACGKASKSSVAAWFCLWDCILEAARPNININNQ